MRGVFDDASMSELSPWQLESLKSYRTLNRMLDNDMVWQKGDDIKDVKKEDYNSMRTHFLYLLGNDKWDIYSWPSLTGIHLHRFLSLLQKINQEISQKYGDYDSNVYALQALIEKLSETQVRAIE